MDAPAHRVAHRLAFLVTFSPALVVIVALCAVMVTPWNADLSITTEAAGRMVVAWVAPDGPAWSAGIAPGNVVVDVPHGGHNLYVVAGIGRQFIILPTRDTVPALLGMLMAGLGLTLCMFGNFVFVKGRDRAASTAFWRLSALMGLAVGLVPAAIHGLPWVLLLHGVVLRLFGPAFAELAMVFPHDESKPVRQGKGLRLLLWTPALALIALCPLCWWKPVPLFVVVQVIEGLVLAGYIIGGCARILTILLRAHSAHQRAQFQFLALGLIGGMLPFLITTLLPSVLIGRPIVSGLVSSLAFLLLPLCIGIAIVREEFLGITSLIRRRTLRVVLGITSLSIVAIVAGMFATVASQRWHWPAPIDAAGASILSILGFIALRPWLVERAESVLLRDVYDTNDALLRMGTGLAAAAPHTIGSYTAAYLCTLLDVSFTLAITAHEHYVHSYSGRCPDRLLDVPMRRAQALYIGPPSFGMIIEHVNDEDLLFLSVRDDNEVYALFGFGPKRSGDRYTRQDWALLGILGSHLALQFHAEYLQDQLVEQGVALHELQEVDVQLTRCEIEVLCLAARGLPTDEIAGELGRHERTIEKHLTKIYRKLGVPSELGGASRQKAVMMARRKHILPPDETTSAWERASMRE